MPTSSTNFGLQKPLVNNATDADLWGGQLNGDIDSIDALLLTSLNWTPSTQTSTITVTAMTSGSTATGSNRTLFLCNATGGAFAANLPAVATASGLTVAFKKTDSSNNAITITGHSSETIDGSNTLSLGTQYQYVILACDGTNWDILSQTPPAVSFNNVALTGTPTAPTAAVNTSTTQVATTAFANPASTLSNPLNVELPSGIIIKAGSFGTPGQGNTQTNITFATPFPNAIVGVYSNGRDSPGYLTTAESISAQSVSGFTLYSGTTGSNWWAIGY